jgi:hypothetical protein
MLAYFLWMGRQSGRMQAAFIIGTLFGGRLIRSMAESDPKLGMVLWPLMVLFYLFIYLSWTAVPMFNLLLRFDRFGRLVLSHDERVASNWFGLCVLPALVGLATWATRGGFRFGVAAAVCAVLSICIAVTFGRTGKSRGIFGTASVVMALIGCAGVGLLFAGLESAYSYLTVFIVAFLGIQIGANFVRR